MIVVDASLAAKWYLEEADTRQAFDFLDRNGGDLLAPDLILTEVAGAIIRRVNAGGFSPEHGRALLQGWLIERPANLITLQASTDELLLHAGQIAIDLRHPIQDCIYLALALATDSELVTCDRKFADRARQVHDGMKTLNG